MCFFYFKLLLMHLASLCSHCADAKSLHGTISNFIVLFFLFDSCFFKTWTSNVAHLDSSFRTITTHIFFSFWMDWNWNILRMFMAKLNSDFLKNRPELQSCLWITENLYNFQIHQRSFCLWCRNTRQKNLNIVNNFITESDLLSAQFPFLRNG